MLFKSLSGKCQLRLILLITAVIHGSVTCPVSANNQTSRNAILLKKRQLVSEAAGKPNISRMVQRSDLIIRGKVISTESQWKEDFRGRHIYTSVTVKVLDKIKGNIKDDAFAFEVVGGTVDDIGEVVSGTPAFEIDDDAILFLAGYPPAIQHGTNDKISIYDSKVYRDDLEITVDSFIRALKILEQDPNAPISLEGKHRAPTEGVTAAECFIYNGYKWSGTSPVVYYKINQNTSDCTGEGAAVQRAADTWNNVGANFTFQYDGSCFSTGSSEDGTNCITWGTTVYQNYLAEATVYYYTATKVIFECDIVFNDSDYEWSTNLNTPLGEYDVESVALHELGHWLNLADLYDYADRYEVMYYQFGAGVERRELHQCDIDGICYIYGCLLPSCSPPTAVSAGDGTYTSYVQVTWNSVGSPCNYYRVYRAASSTGTKTALGSGCQTSTTYSDYSATPGITYYYWVKSAKDSSCSDASDFSSYNTGWRKLSPPTSVSASDGAYIDRVCITWNSVTGASYYRVYRATSSTGTKTALGSWQTSTSFCDYTAGPGVTYYYWVKAATNSSGSRASDYSAYDTGWILECSITVTSPGGGLWWEVGETLPIRWDSENTSGDVQIELYKAGSFEWIIDPTTDDDGVYDWPIPVNGSLIGGNEYQVKVTDVSNSSCYDFSNDFGIGTPPEAQDDTVTTSKDTPVRITLQASDEGQPDPPAALTYIITSLPIHGDLNEPGFGLLTDPCTSLVGYVNQVEYIPHIGYEGQDSFTFIANDGGVAPGSGDSRQATVSINVTACIFFDDFPSTTLDFANWTETYGTPTIDDLAGDEPSPPYSLHLEDTDAVTGRVIDLSECFSAQLHYWWKRVSTESGDDLYVDYWDGNVWQLLQMLPGGTNNSWEQNSVELPDGALHSEFHIRFWADCDSSSDEWYIDDLCLQYQSCIDHPSLYPEPDTTKGLCNTIYWNPVADANAYYAECANDANFRNIIANSGWITDTNYEFCSLENGQIYWYRAKAWVPYSIETWMQTSQPDFENDALTDTTATTDGNVVLAKTGPTVDTVGGTNLTIPPTNTGYFNGFLVTTDTTLTQIEVYLGISASRAIDFVIYEGGTLFTDPYCRIHSSIMADSGTGEKFYSSGTISVSLKAGRHYMIGAVWSNYVTVFYNDSHSSPGFADHTGWGFYYGFPSPACSNISSGAPTLCHRYTSGTEVYSKSGSVVSSAIELPVNCNWNWDVVDFNTTMPANTELTVDVLNGADQNVIVYDITPGADISNISETSIKLRANLSTDDPNNTPALHDWSISYDKGNWSNIESSRQCNTPGDFEPDCDVDWADLRVLCDLWLLGELSADVSPDGGDGFVNFLDWAIFADGWHTTSDIFDLTEFVEQWLKTEGNYYIADIAPGGGDGFVNLLDFAALAENWLLDLTGPVQK